MAGVTEIRGDITGVTNAKPGVVTSASHGLSEQDIIRITQVDGLHNFNNKLYFVNQPTTNTFKLKDPNDREDFDTTTLGTYQSGGRWNRVNRVGSNRVVYEK